MPNLERSVHRTLFMFMYHKACALAAHSNSCNTRRISAVSGLHDASLDQHRLTISTISGGLSHEKSKRFPDCRKSATQKIVGLPFLKGSFCSTIDQHVEPKAQMSNFGISKSAGVAAVSATSNSTAMYPTVPRPMHEST